MPVINIEPADSQFASAYLSFTSNILQANEITDYLTRIVQPRLTALPGVQRAEILGGRTFAMRIWLKPDRMAALNVSPAQVRQALAANNFLSAVGSTKGSLVQVDLTANTDLHSVQDFKNLVVRQENNVLVRLGDIADVVLGAEDYNSRGPVLRRARRFHGHFRFAERQLDRRRQAGPDRDGCRFRRNFPPVLQGRIAYDGTEYINTAIHDVFRTLMETLLIVVIVIFLFLGSWRSVIIPVVAIPISLIGAVFLMQVFGFTINLLTLLAIVLSVGLVVDDAIVVVENVERHLREGLSPTNAALLGARELIGPIIAMTITLAAVYVPIGIQGGLTGTLFREFAFTLAGAVTISGVVALTLSPMMSAQLLARRRRGARLCRQGQPYLRSHPRVRTGACSIAPCRCARRFTSPGSACRFSRLLLLKFSISMNSELAPTEDQGVIFGIIDAPANATIEQTAAFADAAEKEFLSFPETNFTFQLTFPSSGFGGMVFKPWGQAEGNRRFNSCRRCRQKLGTIPGIQMFPVMPPALPGGGQFPVEFVILSTAEPEQMLGVRQAIAGGRDEEWQVRFPADHRYENRPAAG